MTLSLRSAVVSDIGPFRSTNQDAAFFADWAVGVADGVGGGPAGDLASAALVHRLAAGSPRAVDAAGLIDRIRWANWDLRAHVRRDPALAGMATTLTTIWLSPAGGLVLAHTGDSRAYLLRDGRFQRQTRDDSLVQALVDQGVVRAEDAMTHPQRNVITASLRGGPADVVHVADLTPLQGDRWVICSDGVSDYLPDDAIAEIAAGTTDPDATAQALVALALQAGSRDNVTAVVADLVPGIPTREPARFAGSAADLFAEAVDIAG
ncbi:PP2C family protein-serine/threonine phosphatase [Microbacterium flavum]|uniref:PP2C family protein-serine/threonine phosphatase n=1 Tax=Microbacterium flavum TaxID=415216 RepID=UPI0024ADE58D|nr:protein phosphatase 2C domain-containing protein [Microbacterium flavum]